MRKAQTNSLRSTLERLLEGMDSSTRVRESMALAYWAEVAGSQMAAASEAVEVRDGVLFVNTKSATHSQELAFYKAAIIARLNARIGAPVIRNIVFRAKGVRRAADEQTHLSPTEEELAAIQISAADAAWLRAQERDLAAISDARIRLAVRARLEREVRLRIWREAHGWRRCARCGRLHPLQGDLCPMCRAEG
ncbi:MAG: DciA family protein [Chthonomonadales bacterium]